MTWRLHPNICLPFYFSSPQRRRRSRGCKKVFGGDPPVFCSHLRRKVTALLLTSHFRRCDKTCRGFAASSMGRKSCSCMYIGIGGVQEILESWHSAVESSKSIWRLVVEIAPERRRGAENLSLIRRASKLHTDTTPCCRTFGGHVRPPRHTAHVRGVL